MPQNNSQFDPDGFLKSPDSWNDDIAQMIAKDAGIDNLTEEHWKLIRFMREYWLKNGTQPEVRVLCQETGIGLRSIYKMFPEGPERGIGRIAGLPKRDGCV